MESTKETPLEIGELIWDMNLVHASLIEGDVLLTPATMPLRMRLEVSLAPSQVFFHLLPIRLDVLSFRVRILVVRFVPCVLIMEFIAPHRRDHQEENPDPQVPIPEPRLVNALPICPNWLKNGPKPPPDPADPPLASFRTRTEPPLANLGT